MQGTNWIRRSMRSRGRRIGVGIALAVLAAGVGGLIVAARNGSADANRIIVSATACAPGWTPPASGRTVLTVANTSAHTTYGIDLIGRDQVSVYGEIETLAPGTDDTMDVILPPGHYTLECESFSGGSLYSRVVQVQGLAVSGTHAFTPVSSDQIQLATNAYRAKIVPLLGRLQRDTDALAASVRAGRLAAARSLWLPAHLDYERLGAAYDTFGTLGDQIDERPSGLEGGVHDAHFQGFLRLEYGLWHGQSSSELIPVANALDGSVHTLVRRFPKLPTPSNDLSLRTHEILENTLQFELTGQTDMGSHSGLATAWANVQGTELALASLAPLLSQTSPALASSAQRGLVRLGATLRSYERPDGSWRPLQSLSTGEREHLDGATSALLERLSQIPTRLEIPRRPPADNDEQSDD